MPQNIDLQDKIIGPLTMIQFLYVLAGGVIDYLLFAALKGGLLFWIIGIPVAVIASALAFLKFQDQPLSHFISASIVFYMRPKKRFWQRKGFDFEMVKESANKKIVEANPVKRRAGSSELEKLAYMLDTRAANKSN